MKFINLLAFPVEKLPQKMGETKELQFDLTFLLLSISSKFKSLSEKR